MKRRIPYSILALALVLGMVLPFAAPVSASEISLKKNTDPLVPNKYYVGDIITYVLEVGNPASNTATNYLDYVLDTLPNGSSVTIDTDVTHAPGESSTYYLDYVVNEADLRLVLGRWRVVNLLRVVGTDSLFDIIDATTSKSSIILRPQLSIEKTVDFNNDGVFTSSETYYAGEPARWAIVVTNTGYDPVYDIYVSDDNMGGDFHGPFDLAPGQSEVVPVYTTYPVADTLNTACAQGTDELGNPVGPVCDDAAVLVTGASIDLRKLVNGQDADSSPGPVVQVGSTVTFQFVVTNTGKVALAPVVVTDSVLGNIGTIPSLSPGESETLSATGTAIAGQHSNMGTATGSPPTGPDVSDTDPGHYSGADSAPPISATPPVGWNSHPVNKPAVLAPLVGLAVAIVIVAGLLIRRRHGTSA